MNSNHPNSDLQFLSGGGEMGTLTRAKDWSKTTIGDPHTWPQSLRTTLSILLNAKFPMFLFWGPELISFYNDAFRPGLGIDGKHPSILGQPAEKAWTETWPVIKPMIAQVLSGGEAILSEDQLIPIYRNGKMEDVYWTFSYSPVTDESGKIFGVFVTCSETNEKTELRLHNIAERLNIVIEASELGTWEWNIQTDQIIYSKRYLEIFGHDDELSTDHKKHLAHVHPDDRHIRDMAVTRAMKKGHLDYQVRIIWNDRSVHWIEAKGKVFYDAQTKPEKLIGTIRDITSDKYRQQELLENEQRFRLLADSMPQQIWTADAEGNMNYYNQSVFNYTGLTLEQIDAEGWIQMVHPDDRAENARQWIEAVSWGQDFLFEHRFRRYDGEYRWQLSRATPQKDSNGNIQMWVGTSTDIHDQKTFTSELEKQVRERTRELKKSEERYHLMVEEVQDYAILYLNREGIVENWNKGAEKIKGYRAEEIIGKSFSTFYTERDRDNHLPQKLLKEAAETGKALQEGWRVHKNGKYFWASVVITAVHDDHNQVIGFSKVTHDLTEKKAAEDTLRSNSEQLEIKNRELKKSEERYHLMVEEVQDYAILYLNREGIVENWNKGAEKIKGYRADEIIGKNFSTFYTERDRESNLPQKLLKLAADTGKALQEGWRVRKNGSLFWASVVITAVHNEQGNVIGFSKVTHDLTDKKIADDTLKMAAEQLALKNNELEKMNVELQSFAYVSSHDLQEPLRKIQTFASRVIAKEADHLSDTGKDYFLRMQEAAARMQTLIQDLLAYSRTSTGERSLEETDLGEMLADVKNDLKEMLAEKGAVVETGTMCHANIIPFQFRQLLYNLIGNAVKFSKPGEAPHVLIKSKILSGEETGIATLSPHKSYCHISVSDNGIGFDEQYKERIFVVFQRLHGRERYSGTGIGLAIVKKIVENHGGIITASGEINKGATFDIFIPS